ncbi:MAG: hypothetical protein MHM6MM_002739 [Cercozoa sp. M6MM]
MQRIVRRVGASGARGYYSPHLHQVLEDGKQYLGRISKWYGSYGFVKEVKSGETLMLHYTEVLNDGFVDFRQDDPVMFRAERQPNQSWSAVEASRVRPMEDVQWEDAILDPVDDDTFTQRQLRTE